MLRLAITRKPGSSYSEGITTAHLGKPDLGLALLQHKNYVNALKTCGLEVMETDGIDEFPDSCFVEDTAVVIDEAAIITKPGAASRKGEIYSMIPILEKFRTLFFIEPPGTLEGGDVMQVDKHFYIGVTARTNEDGANQLGSILSGLGYSFSIIPVTSVLHLKTAINYIGNNNLLASEELASHHAFSNFHVSIVSKEDLYAANCLQINGRLIMPKGFGRVKTQLMRLNYDIIELDMSEFEKMDGGLTCLSLRFS